MYVRVKSACQRLLTLGPPISLWLANMAVCVCTPRGPNAAAAAERQLSVRPKIKRQRSHKKPTIPPSVSLCVLYIFPTHFNRINVNNH